MKDIQNILSSKRNAIVGNVLHTDLTKAKTYSSHSTATIIYGYDNKVLFLKRSADDDLAPGTWCLPGGGVDPGETMLEGAVREVKEESDVDVKIRDLYPVLNIEVSNNKLIHYFDCYLYRDYQEVSLLDGESDNYSWMSREEWEHEDVELILDLKAHLKYIMDGRDITKVKTKTVKNVK